MIISVVPVGGGMQPRRACIVDSANRLQKTSQRQDNIRAAQLQGHMVYHWPKGVLRERAHGEG
jgi:hypothetical protein